MYIIYNNRSNINSNNKKIISILSLDNIDNARLDSFYFNNISKNFERISYFLKHYNKILFDLRDIVYSEIDNKNFYNKKISSSFLDFPVVPDKNFNSCVLNNLNSIIYKDIESESTKTFYFKNINKMHNRNIYNIHDNYDYLNTFDYLVLNSNLSDDEIFIFNTLFLIFSLPLIEIPIYLIGIFDFDYGKFQISHSKLINNSIEMKEYLKSYIMKLDKILIYLNKVIKDILKITKKSFIFMININYFETIIDICDKSINCTYKLIFNPTDFYRLIRVFSANLFGTWNNTNTTINYYDIVELSDKLLINQITDSLNLYDSIEYVLEYRNRYCDCYNERIEYQNIF